MSESAPDQQPFDDDRVHQADQTEVLLITVNRDTNEIRLPYSEELLNTLQAALGSLSMHTEVTYRDSGSERAAAPGLTYEDFLQAAQDLWPDKLIATSRATRAYNALIREHITAVSRPHISQLRIGFNLTPALSRLVNGKGQVVAEVLEDLLQDGKIRHLTNVGVLLERVYPQVLAHYREKVAKESTKQ